ncbi:MULTISPECIES: helix-turn-helix domain-containing protein [unclassified Brevundimonas]|uniref:helix-turn-helix domain-containing protein n=1 Tax=unclassified Brevundimonas TaxID=2622653 RepID=UPI0025C24180|nr:MULTISPECIES: helix-turn-helix domain-containing protein [unclassified Brevundimonas]
MDQDRQDAPSLEDAETLGEALRAARLASGRSMAQLSTMTRVHPRYLTALEQNEFSVLPSRIFSMGYVRAYAGALGLDELTAVERFKREFPEAAVPLQAPTGAALQQMRRTSPKILAALGVLIVAVVGWNVFQRVVRIEPPHPSDLVAVPRNWAEEADAEVERALYLGAPRAAPPDQTTPALYITPGLEAQLTGIDPDDPNAAVVLPAPPVQAAFNPRGAVYGASATTSQVILQARKPAALVVRQGDGRILFARQLAAGEAWRAPPGLSATIDVSDPAAFDVYLNGEHSGALPAAQSPLGTLNARAQTEARQSEARAAAAAEAQARARAAQAAAQAAAPPPAVAPAG